MRVERLAIDGPALELPASLWRGGEGELRSVGVAACAATGDGTTLLVVADGDIEVLRREDSRDVGIALWRIDVGSRIGQCLVVLHPAYEVVALSRCCLKLDGLAEVELSGSRRYGTTIGRQGLDGQRNLTTRELNPCGLLANDTIEAFGISDTSGLNGQHVVAVTTRHSLEIEIIIVLIFLCDNNLRGIEMLALTLQRDVVGCKRSGIDGLVEANGQLLDGLRGNSTLLRNAYILLDSQLNIGLGCEGEDERLASGRHVSHEVQAVLAYRVAAVAQGAVGLPDIIDFKFLTIALTDDTSQRLTANGGIQQIAVSPSCLRRQHGEVVLGIALLVDGGTGQLVDDILRGIREVDGIRHVLSIEHVVDEEGTLGCASGKRWREAANQLVDGDLVE